MAKCIALKGDYIEKYVSKFHPLVARSTGPRSTVGNVSDYRYASYCIPRGREFSSGPIILSWRLIFR